MAQRVCHMERVKSQMNRKPRQLYKLGIAAVVVIATPLAAVEFYSVREFAAALLIFSVLFGAIGTVLLSLILIQAAAVKGVARIEARLAHRRGHLVFRSARWN
jgi:hypothetical protein